MPGAQTLKTFENALKEYYLPVWRNQLGTEPSALLSKIKKVPIKSDKIVTSAPIGLSGGFGYGAEGESTPEAGKVNFARFMTNAKDMYVNMCISLKSTKLTGSAGAMADALDTEVKASYETAKWNVGRSLFGNGTGILTTITTGSAGTITCADVSKLKEGLIVDVYANGTGGDAPPTVKASGIRITAVDRSTKKITVTDTTTAFTAGFITVQNSYNREITGLGSIFDDTVKSIYGIDKSKNIYLKPIVVDANNDISDGIITGALRQSSRDKNGEIDMILCGDAAYDNYVEYLRTNNIRVEDRSKEIAGGFKAIKFIFANREVDIVNEGFVPEDEFWGVSTKDLELHETGWNFASVNDSSIFTLLEGQSIYRALLANYGELICKNPGACVRITNCA